MIGGWLLKIVIVIGLLGFVLVEAGSPIIVHAQIDGAAHDAADNAAAEYRNSANIDAARAKCQAVADDKGAKIVVSRSAPVTGCDPDGNDPTVWHVTLEKEARSVLFKKWSRLRHYYDVKVSASSQKRGSTDKL